MYKLNKEVVVVTGASRGIGQAIALKFHNEGYLVIPFGRDENKLKKLSESLFGNENPGNYYAGDVADPGFVNDSVSDLLKKYGRIDHLINNAGVAVFESFVDSSLENFRKQVDTNLYGVYNFTKAVVKQMMENKSGSIINISSLAGKNGFAGGSLYVATKHAVMGLTKSLMLELRKYNIRVAAVCPGSVATDMLIDTPIQPEFMDKVLQPEDVAEVVLSIIKLPARALVSEIDIRPTNPK